MDQDQAERRIDVVDEAERRVDIVDETEGRADKLIASEDEDLEESESIQVQGVSESMGLGGSFGEKISSQEDESSNIQFTEEGKSTCTY